MKAEGSAVVTGASRGLGRAVAIELSARGFSVVATMRDPTAGTDLPSDARARGGKVRVEALDITDPEGFSFPDDLTVLVNNAGLRLKYLPVEETPLEEWREVFETNVFGTIEVIRRAIPILRSNGGVICNVTSSSILSPFPFFGTYRASKWAISALSETLRAELAPFGIRVIEILPGPIDTELLATSVMYRLPEAAAFPAYRHVAERNFPSAKGVASEYVTSPDIAAAAIADAVFDDGGPMRYGCDPLSVNALGAWRQASDEDTMSQSLARFAAES
jgi:NAD(P)-dependent dehydrogenase (short-subunit alcohol dehydrogenase family)